MEWIGRITLPADARRAPDVDAPSTAIHEISELAPGDPLHRIVSRGSLLALYGQTDTEPAVFALDPSRPQEPMKVGEAWFFIPSVEEERVWLAILDPTSPSTVRALAAVREATLDGRMTFHDVEPPEGRWPVAAAEGGLLFQSDTELELWDPTSRTFTNTLPGASRLLHGEKRWSVVRSVTKVG